jgi:cell division protein FtsL
MSVAFIILFIYVTAVALVYIKHRSRVLFVQSQVLEKEQKRLADEWSMLLVEQGTLLSHGKVEREARKTLKMREPTDKHVVVVQ